MTRTKDRKGIKQEKAPHRQPDRLSLSISGSAATRGFPSQHEHSTGRDTALHHDAASLHLAPTLSDCEIATQHSKTSSNLMTATNILAVSWHLRTAPHQLLHSISTVRHLSLLNQHNTTLQNIINYNILTASSPQGHLSILKTASQQHFHSISTAPPHPKQL